MVKQGAILVQRAGEIESEYGIKFERIPENPEDYNCHILYNFQVKQVDDNNAIIGWCNTGYIGEYLPGFTEPMGSVCAPAGFVNGGLAFIIATEPKLKKFLEHRDIELDEKLGGRYSMVGFS